MPLADHGDLFHQHDVAPRYNVHLVKNMFYDQWIVNNGPHLWPSRSSDLTVLGFFIWRTVKNKVDNYALTTTKESIVKTSFEELEVYNLLDGNWLA